MSEEQRVLAQWSHTLMSDQLRVIRRLPPDQQRFFLDVVGSIVDEGDAGAVAADDKDEEDHTKKKAKFSATKQDIDRAFERALRDIIRQGVVQVETPHLTAEMFCAFGDHQDSVVAAQMKELHTTLKTNEKNCGIIITIGILLESDLYKRFQTQVRPFTTFLFPAMHQRLLASITGGSVSVFRTTSARPPYLQRYGMWGDAKAISYATRLPVQIGE
jgi:hypothetical protein